MSYRRKSETAEELRQYKAFCRDNFHLIEQIGLPSLVVEDYDAFIYFLMHGGTWPHAPISFGLENLTQEQRQAYLLLLDRYFDAGFAYPGLMGLTQAERSEVERKHPKQFSQRQK
jgi:hypothetical protein